MKTTTMASVEPLNDLWAQSLRKEARSISIWQNNVDDLIFFFDSSLSKAKEIGSDSPVKIALRTFDQRKIYDSILWETIEPYLQRTLFNHPHCIDYITLLVAKRVALRKNIDKEGWSSASYHLIQRHLPLNHHHEIVWLVWLLIVGKLELPERLVVSLSNDRNAHIRSLVVAAHVDGIIDHKPPIRLGARLATTDEHWLLNLVAKAKGYSNAPFTGSLSTEFEHLANKHVRLIDFESHTKSMEKANARAISLTRYGYDNDHYDEDEIDDDAPWN